MSLDRRDLAKPDRRRWFRGGRRLTDLFRASMVVGTLPLAATASAREAPTVTVPMQFGVDMASVKSANSRGAGMAYGTFWIGAWTQKYGWGYAEAELRTAAMLGVTPVVNWWYWGDDISPDCVEHGCEDRRQHVRKDKATWLRMSRELADRIDRSMSDRGAVVVLETEFNKNGIETYEPFDGYLADVAQIFHRKRNIKVVIGFGNWGREHWRRFDRAVAESDLLGTQLLQSSVHDASTYRRAVETLIAGASYLHTTFGKPCLVVDLGLSSYPAPEYESVQATVVEELFARLPELKAAGVRGVLWRQIADDPKFDTSNYHGVAERHWGLLRADGTAKPAFTPFVEGIRAESGQRPLATR